MKLYKRTFPALFLIGFILIALLGGCSVEPPKNENGLETDTTVPPSIEIEIAGTWKIAAIWVHGDSKKDYVSEVYLTFSSDGAVDLSDNNFEEPMIYKGTYYAENGKIYTDYTSVNQESFEVSPKNMNGEITIDSATGELVYDYINDTNGLTWYFVKQ